MGIISNIGTDFNKTEDINSQDILQELKISNILARISSILKHPNYIPSIANIASSTSTLQNPITLFDTPIGSNYGAVLASVSLSADTVFQSDYYWQLSVSGITNPNPPFMPFDPTVNTFDLIPAGVFFLLKPGSAVKIKAYNHNTANITDGLLSIYVVVDILTQNESEVLFNNNK